MVAEHAVLFGRAFKGMGLKLAKANGERKIVGLSRLGLTATPLKASR